MAARLAFVALALLVSACGPGANHQKSPIGSACQHDDDCGTKPYLCIAQTTADGKTLYPGGYCTLPCVAGATTACPTDSICVVGECRRLCADASDCRVVEKYACVPVGTKGSSSTFCDDPDAL